MAGSKFSLQAILTLTDKLTRPYKKTTSRITALNKGLGQSFKKMSAGIARGLLTIAKVGLAALAGGIVLATREFVRFDDTIVGATARFKDLEIGTKESALAMEQLKKTARDVAKVTQFTATEAAAGLNFFAKAGFTSVEAMAALKTQVDLATVAELDLARTSDITSDLLASLGLNAADSTTKIENLAKLSNSLGIASNMANVTLEDMFETLKVAGPIATEAGEEMNQLIAITAALGGAGIKGTMAATALKNAYVRLAAPTNKVTAALEELGLKQSDFIDMNGDMKSMVDIMQQLGDAASDIGGAKRLGLFAQIFGKQAVAGATNMAKSLSEIELTFRALEGDRRIEVIADQIRTGLGMQVKILKSGLIELGFQFVEAFEKNGRGLLEKLITGVQNFDMKPIIEGAKLIGRVFKQLIDFATPLIETIIKIGKEIFVMFTETEIGQKVIKLLGELFNALRVAIEIMWKVAKPIFKAMLAVLDPILTVVNAIVKAIVAIAEFSIKDVAGPEGRTQAAAARERGLAGIPGFSTPGMATAGFNPATMLNARQEAAVQETRNIEESKQRMDLFFNLPPGASVSSSEGGAPITAVKLGEQ